MEAKFWSSDIAFLSLHFKDNVREVDKTFKESCWAITDDTEPRTSDKVHSDMATRGHREKRQNMIKWLNYAYQTDTNFHPTTHRELFSARHHQNTYENFFTHFAVYCLALFYSLK